MSIYNSSSPEEIQYLAEHAEAEIAIVEDAGFLQRILKVRDELPPLQKIFVLRPPDGDLPDGVHPASELMAHGSADLAALAADTSPDDLATLIYTSGTTGPPKGVMLSQYNVVYTVELLLECFERTRAEALGWRVVSYLPMAHIAERSTSHYGALVFGYEVSCCPDPNQLMPYLKEVHPQLMFGVPRVYEKIYAGVNAALAGDPEKQASFNDGVAAAIQINRAQRDRHGDAGADRHAGVPRRRGVLGGARPRRPRLDRDGDHRRRAAPGRDPRVVQRDRRAAVGDLRHVRVDRADHVVAAAQQAGLRRPGDPGHGGRDRRGRRGGRPRRQRVPGLPQAARQDRRDRRSTAGCTPATSA